MKSNWVNVLVGSMALVFMVHFYLTANAMKVQMNILDSEWGAMQGIQLHERESAWQASRSEIMHRRYGI